MAFYDGIGSAIVSAIDNSYGELIDGFFSVTYKLIQDLIVAFWPATRELLSAQPMPRNTSLTGSNPATKPWMSDAFVPVMDIINDVILPVALILLAVTYILILLITVFEQVPGLEIGADKVRKRIIFAPLLVSLWIPLATLVLLIGQGFSELFAGLDVAAPKNTSVQTYENYEDLADNLQTELKGASGGIGALFGFFTGSIALIIITVVAVFGLIRVIAIPFLFAIGPIAIVAWALDFDALDFGGITNSIEYFIGLAIFPVGVQLLSVLVIPIVAGITNSGAFSEFRFIIFPLLLIVVPIFIGILPWALVIETSKVKDFAGQTAQAGVGTMTAGATTAMSMTGSLAGDKLDDYDGKYSRAASGLSTAGGIGREAAEKVSEGIDGKEFMGVNAGAYMGTSMRAGTQSVPGMNKEMGGMAELEEKYGFGGGRGGKRRGLSQKMRNHSDWMDGHSVLDEEQNEHVESSDNVRNMMNASVERYADKGLSDGDDEIDLENGAVEDFIKQHDRLNKGMDDDILKERLNAYEVSEWAHSAAVADDWDPENAGSDDENLNDSGLSVSFNQSFSDLDGDNPDGSSESYAGKHDLSQDMEAGVNDEEVINGTGFIEFLNSNPGARDRVFDMQADGGETNMDINMTYEEEDAFADAQISDTDAEVAEFIAMIQDASSMAGVKARPGAKSTSEMQKAAMLLNQGTVDEAEEELKNLLQNAGVKNADVKASSATDERVMEMLEEQVQPVVNDAINDELKSNGPGEIQTVVETGVRRSSSSTSPITAAEKARVVEAESMADGNPAEKLRTMEENNIITNEDYEYAVEELLTSSP